MNNKDNHKTHSRLGVISVIIALSNIGISAYLFYRMTRFLISQPELIKNPMLINGMAISQSTYNLLLAFFVLQAFGLILGVGGLMESKTKKLFPALGTFLNGLFVLTTAIKLGII